ncbi:MAG: DUF1003 domain-containing protein [Phototrophicaceae bacterium]|jgi:uncharacterized membrane protein
MYNDLLLKQLAALREDADEETVQHLITEIEELDTLLDPEAQSLVEDLRQYSVSDNVYEDIEENASFGDRMADHIAELAGSWGFIISFLGLMALWIVGNLLLGERAFDTFPFILLNLGLSTLAALQAPVILMSQNRQAEKDRAVARNDYEVNLKSELEIVDLHRKLDVLVQQIEVQNKLVNALVAARRSEVSATVQAIEQSRQTISMQ